jgi:putative SOS response-associated peptidase YedK
MCGRFVSASPPDELARYFDVDQVAESLAGDALDPSFNVAPTNSVYVVYEDGDIRLLDAFHWGLIPFWAKDAKVGYKMINARAETVREKNTYKKPFERRRCIIPADGFFEWKKLPDQKAKQPMYIHRVDDEPLAFAGLWEIWKPKGPDGEYTGEEIRSCTIVTCEANETMAPIHDRMPVLLPPAAWDQWLEPDNHDTATLGQLLVPAPPTLLATHPVSPRVGNVRNKDSALIEPFDPDGPDPGGAAG